MEKEITFITGNWAKIAMAKQHLEPFGIKVNNLKMDTPEIQSDSISEVSKYSAEWASKKIGGPALVNDTGLFIKGLNDGPGVYTHPFENMMGIDGILKLMDGVEDREASFRQSLAYAEPGFKTAVFEGITKGRISTEKSGTYGWSFDFIFIPEGEDKTLGNFPDEKRWNFWSKEPYIKLGEYLNDDTMREKVANVIKFFQPRHYYLDNFSQFQVNISGIPFPTSEQAYQFLKFIDTDPKIAEKIKDCHSAHEAKAIADENVDKVRKNWDQLKLSAMEAVLRAKAEQNPYILEQLLKTGDATLVENSPFDSFWGWGPDKTGENHLGKLWMKIRDEYLN